MTFRLIWLERLSNNDLCHPLTHWYSIHECPRVCSSVVDLRVILQIVGSPSKWLLVFRCGCMTAIKGSLPCNRRLRAARDHVSPFIRTTKWDTVDVWINFASGVFGSIVAPSIETITRWKIAARSVSHSGPCKLGHFFLSGRDWRRVLCGGRQLCSDGVDTREMA